jgi:hypothetical protein
MIATCDEFKLRASAARVKRAGAIAEYFFVQAVRFHPPVASSRVPVHIDRRILGLTLCSDRIARSTATNSNW